MRLLAIETSSERGSAALYADGALTESVSAGAAQHSPWLLPACLALLAKAGWALRDLDAIAFGAGPGSFTGLRLACGVAQGLALGAELPVLALGSLEAMASASGREQVYCAVDARMNEIYVAAYRVAGGDPREILAPACQPPELAPLPPGYGWYGCGSAFGAYADRIGGALRSRLAATDPSALPDAAALARLAARRLAQGETGSDPALAAPLYVRDKVALTTAERAARGGKG